MSRICLSLAALLLSLPLLAAADSFDFFKDFSSWRGWSESSCAVVDGSLEISSKEKSSVISKSLPVQSFAGRRLVLSAEVERDIPQVLSKYLGGKFGLHCKSKSRGDEWPGVYMAPGKAAWESETLLYDVPSDAESLELMLGVQDGLGCIRFRSLKLEAEAFLVDFSGVANMGYKDAKANDGQGGWSDQGPRNDAANFKFQSKLYANIPFHLLDPAKNGGKSVLTFRSQRFAAGIPEAKAGLGNCGVKGQYLYLLHTLTWGGGAKDAVGFVEVVAKDGRKATIPVTGGVDVGDWWNAERKPNGFPAASWKNDDGGIVSVYASKFQIDPSFGELKELVFKSADSSAIWIVLGATLSAKNYSFPESAKLEIKESSEWRQAPARAIPGVLPGSVLDLSDVLQAQSVEETGFVIAGKDGQLAFSKAPGKPARFLVNTILLAPFYGHNGAPKEFTDKESVAAYFDEMRRQGYNMVRFHFLDDTLMDRAAEDYAFKPDALDAFDYAIFSMRKNGIYAMVDAMARRIGYEKGYAWAAEPGDKRNYKLAMFFSEAARENWKTGFAKVVNHVNPYTKTALKDDPVLALVVAFNEQEFAWGSSDLSIARPEWQAFLKEKYKSVQALKTAWGEEANFDSFEEIPPFSSGEILSYGAKGVDLQLFVYKKECELMRWYVATLREMGVKALASGYNMAHPVSVAGAREACDFVAFNNYKAHPFGNVCDPSSSVGEMAKILRSSAAVDLSGKPLVMTEHAHVYWNPYRYEQGLVMGSYSSLQGFGGLSAFASPISIKRDALKQPIASFNLLIDPVMRANEFVTACAFRRMDVAPARHEVLFKVDSEAAIKSMKGNEPMDFSQSSFALVTKIAVGLASQKSVAGSVAEYPICAGGTLVSKTDAFQTSIENSSNAYFDFSKALAELKAKGFVPQSNRTDFNARVFESETGEILLDAGKTFLRVDSPRLQGVCAKAGTKASLSELQIESLSSDGSLVAISRDGLLPLKDAKRILVVYSTNACNSGSVFEDSSFRARLAEGGLPVLLKTGAFKISLKNANAGRFKAYAVGFDGARVAEIPLKQDAGLATLEADAAKSSYGAVFFYELSAQN